MLKEQDLECGRSPISEGGCDVEERGKECDAVSRVEIRECGAKSRVCLTLIS